MKDLEGGRIGSEAQQQLHKELNELQLNCESVLSRVRSIYGVEDDRTFRAQELWNDFQRLHWALTGHPNDPIPVISTHSNRHEP